MHILIIAAVTLMSLMSPPASQAEPLRLTNFSATPNEPRWQIVNDTVMGGRSNSAFEIADEMLTFTGRLNTNGGGFASIRSERLAQDLTHYQSVRLKVLGDGRTYRFRMFVDNDRASYQHSFNTVAGEWLVVTLPIAEFKASWRGRRMQRPPLQAKDVVGLGIILADGIDGPFKLQVSWVEVDGASPPAMSAG